MMPEMQERFRSLSERREMWAGGQMAPHQDLSGLFVVRACELYLRKGGRFAMVLPNAAVDREHYSGFRRGRYSDELGSMAIKFDTSWDLRRIRPHFFPRAASVVFGERLDDFERALSEDEVPTSTGMPDDVEIWTGQLEAENAPWSTAASSLTRTPGTVQHVGQLLKSQYAPQFTQGATFVPRLAFVVAQQAASPLGLSHGRIAVQSHRSVLEKRPWRNLPDLSGVIESQFLRPFFAGENVYPFRIGPSMLAILPCGDDALLGPEQIGLYSGLQNWWFQATTLWDEHRANDRMTLTDRLDYQSTLSKQLPISPLRVLYNRSGMHICAAKLRDERAMVTSGLYWAPVSSEEEADFLCAVLNAPVITELARPFMSYGKDERDIHKHVWELPIPTFEPTDPLHSRIAELGCTLEQIVATFPIDIEVHFAATRRHIRDFVMETVEGQELNNLVSEMMA